MSTLYKRYIPPKPTVTPQSTPIKQSTPKQPETPEPEKKRKRERSHDEIAERKAKKLRKKGIDPVTVPDLTTSEPVEPIEAKVEENVVASTATPATGGFSHIKNAKKRHKLEKEARKARKAAEKELGAGEGVSEEAEAEAEAPRAVASEPLPETVTSYTNGHVPHEHTTVHQAQPKKRRHRLESVLADAKAEPGAAAEHNKASNNNDQADVRKHCGILGKFQKSVKRTEEDEDKKAVANNTPGPVPTVVSQLSLPEPDIDRTRVEQSATSVLPSWLSQPTLVPSESRATFSDLGLELSTVKLMAGLGFQDALPVQQALIPLLLPPGEAGSSYLPGCEERLPDIAVSAPTGSGKTISYLLPIIQALRKKSSDRGRLRALIIVPTRELALQVDAVAKALSSGSAIKTEHIPGNRTLKEEQQKLINRGRRYDPEECRKRLAIAKLRIDGLDQSSGDAREDTRIDETIADTVAGFVNHIPTYDSAIDLLVATPGRLMEHINNTSGFTLTHVQWLVIDEADKLLDNQQEKVLSELNTEFSRPRSDDEQDARERYLRANDLWDERRERLLRKVVLSATMTRDISKLSSLRLRRPKLVVVRGTEPEEELMVSGDRDGEGGETGSVRQSAEGFELPATLTEYSVPVGDGSEKPLVVVELLRSRLLNGFETSAHTSTADDISDADGDDSDDDSSISSISSASSSDDSDSDSDSDSNARDDDAASAVTPCKTTKQKPSQTVQRPTSTEKSLAPTVLIFTSSNESAHRLAHLFKALKPAWSKYVTTLVKSSRPNVRSKTNEPAIIVSTDRASRGLDSIKGRPITHVVQYDIPRSLIGYIHRVGRTARAGRPGAAWTLFAHREGKWFTQEITQASNVKRAHLVERVKIFNEDQDLKARYGEVLGEMREEVQSGK
ncbi:hypothetical protein AC579_4737 [Pseudocercospora musae]|uniref:ATP-dependent RNA helicase n=1 Tax=Pseudocercospora musae TaxID=113226 RepID=A0A139IQ65_9PEZI|nr:hypothetical protein AC579_4737 [Pseudocercospora musae]